MFVRRRGDRVSGQASWRALLTRAGAGRHAAAATLAVAYRRRTRWPGADLVGSAPAQKGPGAAWPGRPPPARPAPVWCATMNAGRGAVRTPAPARAPSPAAVSPPRDAPGRGGPDARL